MTCKITGFNTHGFLPLRVHREKGVPHMSLVCNSEKRIILSMEGMIPQMYDIAFRVFNYQMDIVQATKGAQVKVQRNGERWGKELSE